MEPIELSAWHESGRIVFAYQNGYTCDGVELSGSDGGNGKSRLNGGDETPIIQAILSGKTQGILLDNTEKAIAVAKKLMKIYCAGSCVRIYQENDRQLSAQTEIDIPGQDLKQLELAQQFLKKHMEGYSEDYLSRVMGQVFQEIKSEATMKPIESLVMQLLKTTDQPITRFFIEDALMSSGFKVQKPKSAGNVGFNIQEDTSPSKETDSTYNQPENPLDEALVKFLILVKKDWSADELAASVVYLKNLFKKLGD